MTILLFPGRHILQTNFQEQYLRTIVQTPLDQLQYLPGSLPRTQSSIDTPIDIIIFAVTSANHQFTRYNPIPFHIRAIGIDRFASDLAVDFRIGYRIFGIPHYAPTSRFAAILLKEIAEQTEGGLALTPDNTIVLTSTLPIAAFFQALGFAILPAESGATPPPATPQQLLGEMMSAGAQWAAHPALRAQVSPTTIALWRDFPEVPRRVLRLWHDPLLTDDGGLTETRNYSTYAQGMSNDAIIDLKYADIRPHILPGRIVDEGCADGALMVRVAQDFPDSDLIGLEIASELIARCHERQRAGEFGDAFVHFHQRNINAPIFEPNTSHTTICNSTLHELWSYNQGKTTILQYLHEKFRQLAPTGRLLIRDVVGPEDLDEPVHLWLTQADGINPTDSSDSVDVASLSTFARFIRFAADFLPQRRQVDPTFAIQYTFDTVGEQAYIVTTKRWAVEFISKKDYTDNWASEMHEEFAFWGFSDWQHALQRAGFQLDPASHVYTNPWIVANRWQGKVALFRRRGDELQPLPFPPTTVALVAVKPHIHQELGDADERQISA